MSPTPDFGDDAFGVGDLNADGHLDVAVASGDLMLGNGDGTFVFGGRFDFGAPWYGSANDVLVAEMSGDGLPDILTSFQPGQVRLLTNRRTSVNTRPTVDAGRIGRSNSRTRRARIAPPSSSRSPPTPMPII